MFSVRVTATVRGAHVFKGSPALHAAASMAVIVTTRVTARLDLQAPGFVQPASTIASVTSDARAITTSVLVLTRQNVDFFNHLPRSAEGKSDEPDGSEKTRKREEDHPSLDHMHRAHRVGLSITVNLTRCHRAGRSGHGYLRGYAMWMRGDRVRGRCLSSGA